MDNYMQWFTLLDLLAVTLLLTANIGYSYVIRSKYLSSNNIIYALRAQRILWMQNMMERDNRFIDVIIVQGFMQTNGLFLTTSVVALGGMIAILGTANAAVNVVNNIPFVMHTTVPMFQIKLLLLVGLFILAFFKFVWAYRLANYATIAIGACPPNDSEQKELRRVQGRLSAKLTHLAAIHFYTGLRSYYFAIAALGWFIHPLVLVITTLWVVLVLYRREYLSRSSRAIHAALHKNLESPDL